MILDATAGNRTMWKYKNSDNIIYIDMERKLEIHPTIFADNTQTPFCDQLFDTIFYDPPHTWAFDSLIMGFPSEAEKRKRFPEYRGVPTYYAGNLFKKRSELIAHIHRAQKEFQRILKDGGLLWFKWNDFNIPLGRLIRLFDDWHELMRLYIKDPTQIKTGKQTYWVVLCKKEEKNTQSSLLQF